MNLSLLSLDCVIPHLDANKRLMLSICYKSFRNLEKNIAIKFDRLKIESSIITINEKRYKLGEIQEFCHIEDVTEKERVRIEKNNSEGGVGWMSRKDAVLEPGDVTAGCRWRDETFLEAEKYELMQSLRRMFMSAVEKFYDSESQYNPLWDVMDIICINTVFKTINTESGEVVKVHDVYSLLEETNPVKLERDELNLLYPKAFKSIVDSIEVLKNRRKGDMAGILTKLAYPQMIYPHFNQFNVVNDDSLDYHNRLPDGLSLRQAFKQFSTLLFGRRNKIHVQKFRLDGQGIIPLPVGFQIERFEDYELFYSWRDYKLLTAYCSTVKFFDRICLSISDEETLRLPHIKNCRIFEICYLKAELPIDAFSDLNNEVLSLKKYWRTSLSPFDFFNEWLKNENRRIGSKFIISFNTNDLSRDSISLETKISKIGFRKTARSSSYYRPLSGGKKAVLHVDKDPRPLSAHLPPGVDLAAFDWNYPDHDCFYWVEIVGSE